MTGEDRLMEAIGELSCALSQVVLGDDRIITGHMEKAIALLREEQRERHTAAVRV
jgi:hypothetical protein